MKEYCHLGLLAGWVMTFGARQTAFILTLPLNGCYQG